jgi:hypothetical protein
VNPADAINFALGAIDMVCVVAANLVGLGMFGPNAFQDDVEKYVALWQRKENPSRGAAARIFLDRLKNIEATKLRVNAHLVLPDANRPN